MFQRRVALLRRGYDAINRRDLGSVLETLDAEVVCVEPPEFPAGGTYVGRGGFAEYLRQNWAIWERSRTVPEGFIEAGEKIVAFVHHAGRTKAGVEVEARFADVFTFRGDKIVRIDAFPNRAAAVEALGLAPSLASETEAD